MLSVFVFPSVQAFCQKYVLLSLIQSVGYENASLGEHFTQLVSSTEIVCNDSLLQVFI